MDKKIIKIGVKERLDLIIKELGISGRTFSRECGFSESYFASINDGIGADKLNKILSTYPQFSAHWLITGDGEMLTGKDNTNQIKSDMTQKFFDELEQRNNQFNELLEQNSRLISVIENMTGTSSKQSHVG
ncbi:hypothetical protein [uncultured Alistipes sp.]|uniref:hypothetical protein n=1 Tax=uncultured Alistipes sp. TaxID=538949 RepID=UPI0025A9F9A3|nr:hypothetical protein [uncultured Alistipes sp.]